MSSETSATPFDPRLWVWGIDDARPRFLHAMLRVTDLEASLRFYVDLIGMKKLDEAFDVPSRKVTAIFIGFDSYAAGGGLELVHKWDEQGPFSHGSGYSHHISFGMPDLDAMVARLDAQGIEFIMRPTSLLQGAPRNLFVKDPDGYQVEMIETRRP